MKTMEIFIISFLNNTEANNLFFIDTLENDSLFFRE